RALHNIQHLPDAEAMSQRALRCSLNHRPVGHRITKRHAKLYDARAHTRKLDEQLARRLKIRIARRDERNQAASSFTSQTCESCFNPAHKISKMNLMCFAGSASILACKRAKATLTSFARARSCKQGCLRSQLRRAFDSFRLL